MLRGFLYGIDANTMILICMFFILFAFLNWILFRVFKNRGTSGIISFCIALMAVYGFNRMRWDFSGLFFRIGISENLLYTVVPILILLFVIFLFWKLKFGGTLMLVGALLIASSLLNLFYEKTLMLIIGGILFVVGGIFWLRKKIKRKGPKSRPPKGKPPKEFPETSKGPDESELRSQGIKLLIRAAKKFKSWALKQKNPKFVGSWAMFVNYLKQGRWGNTEVEICQRLHITQKDFIRIFNRYGKV